MRGQQENSWKSQLDFRTRTDIERFINLSDTFRVPVFSNLALKAFRLLQVYLVRFTSAMKMPIWNRRARFSIVFPARQLPPILNSQWENSASQALVFGSIRQSMVIVGAPDGIRVPPEVIRYG